MKRMRSIGFCLAGLLCVTAVLGLDAMSASALEVLFQLGSGGFPAEFKSSGNSASTFETASQEKFECQKLTDSGTIGSVGEGTKSAHLGLISISFKECSSLGGLLTCQTKGASSGVIEINNITYHLGLADPGDIPALLLLIKTEFECGGAVVKIGGSLIGILAAKVNEPKSIETLSFKEISGVQEKTTFLLSLTSPENEIMTNQFLTETKGTSAGVQLGLISTDTLLEFKNSSKQAAQILLVNG